MSEDLHGIDKLFKESIEEHAEAPPAQVWERLGNKLDQRRVAAISGRYRMLKWVAAALFMISVGMAMWVYHLRSHQPDTQLVKRDATNTHTGVLPSQRTETAQRPPLSQAGTSNDLIHEPIRATDSVAGNIASVPVRTDSMVRNQAAVADMVTVSEKPRPERAAEQARVRSSIVTQMNDKHLPLVKTTDNNKSVLADDFKKNVVKNRGKITTPESETAFAEQPAAADALHPVAIAGPALHEDPVGVNLSILPKPVLHNLIPDRSLDPHAPIVRLTPLHEPAFTATVFFSPNLVSSVVTNDRRVQPYGREDDKNEIKAKEQNGSSHSIGALLHYNFHAHWSLGSGVVVSTRTTEIDAKTIYARPDPRGGGVKYRFNCSSGYSYINLKPGSSNPFNGDSAKALSSINKLQYLSIPLIATYNFGGSRLRFLTSAGVQVNFLTVRKIETFITKGGIREYTNTSDIQGLRSAYLSGIISAGASYRLSRILTASVVPVAQLGFMSINQHAPVKSYINFYGLSMGVSVKL